MTTGCSKDDEGSFTCIAREWESLLLPDELSGDKEFLKMLSSLKTPSGNSSMFDVLFDSDGVRVRPKEYVGIFTLSRSNEKRVFLIVEPKIGVKAIISMLAISLDPGSETMILEHEYIENLVSLPEETESIRDLLVLGVIEKYLEKLNEALLYGFPELLITSIEEGVSIRGRIIESSIPRILVSGSPRLAYQANYYTEHNPITNYILNIAHRLYITKSELLENLGEQASILYTTLLRYDYEPKMTNALNKPLHELLSITPLDRPYVKELLILARIIEGWLIEHTLYPGLQERVPALYINMNTLFESFIRKIFMLISNKINAELGIKVKVSKKRRDKPLIVYPNKKIFLKPDITLETKEETIAVGDVKYKLFENPLTEDEEAIRQIYTYMHAFKVDKGFLVYPSPTNKNHCEQYLLEDGRKLYIAQLYISKEIRDHSELEETKLYDTINGLFRKLIEN